VDRGGVSTPSGPTSADPLVATLRDDGSLLLRLDDGGPNALRPDVLDGLRTQLGAHPEAPVLLSGRDGMLSAGLDLKWMATSTPAAIGELLTACGRTLMALWLHPRPVVAAATGHAIAAGTMLCLAADHVVAAEGGAWGLVETANGMEVPRFGIALATARLAPRELDRLLIRGERMDAARACAIGFADEFVAAAEVEARAEERLAALAALPAEAYAGNKHRLRAPSAARVLDGLAEDVAVLTDGLRRAVG
jgi:enoyl-CoA hydratase